jgi:hypothetical protein
VLTGKSWVWGARIGEIFYPQNISTIIKGYVASHRGLAPQIAEEMVEMWSAVGRAVQQQGMQYYAKAIEIPAGFVS